jgi:glucosylceramidase
MYIMKTNFKIPAIFLLLIILISSCMNQENLDAEIFETSESGNKLTKLTEFPEPKEKVQISILPEEKFQTITGFGGSFTESSAWLLNQLSRENRNLILEAYFGETGARYSLTRTHMNSCDFSLGNYSYAPVAGDMELEHFSIEEDMDDIIPMIKDAMAISKDGFKIISSPWTAPPWMKDNKDWKGGKLLPKYYEPGLCFFLNTSMPTAPKVLTSGLLQLKTNRWATTATGKVCTLPRRSRMIL